MHLVYFCHYLLTFPPFSPDTVVVGKCLLCDLNEIMDLMQLNELRALAKVYKLDSYGQNIKSLKANLVAQASQRNIFGVAVQGAMIKRYFV